MIRLTIFLSLLALITACQPSSPTEMADTIYVNGQIYTVDSTQLFVEAIAIKGDKIMARGNTNEIMALAGDSTLIQDLNGQFMMPGFIEAHGHFAGLGNSLLILNFLDAKNWEEIIAQVKEKVDNTPEGTWIIGRGWHQEKWDNAPAINTHGYPHHTDLSAISPNHPVLLRHASGHGLMANAKAMELAHVSKETNTPIGGEIVRDLQGNAIGVFEETAMDIIYAAYDSYTSQLNEEQQLDQWHKAIEIAQDECIKNGITSFQDAGASKEELLRYQALANNNKMRMRLWSMLWYEKESLAEDIKILPIQQAGDGYFSSAAIKAQIDGALGSYGAWLLDSYSDKTDFVGQNTTPIQEIKDIAQHCKEKKLQLCIHAIGDKANRETLNIYEDAWNGTLADQDVRWRIEHAQHIDSIDIPRFGQLNVIAAMQGVHCISDAPYVEKRLGKHRAEYNSYPWRSLLETGAVIANGTDTPVEKVNPIPSFYASVTRQQVNSDFVFYPQQNMTRAEAIRSYTLDAAYAAFEDHLKGSIEVGKFADLVVLSNNLLTCSDEEILDTHVKITVVGGVEYGF